MNNIYDLEKITISEDIEDLLNEINQFNNKWKEGLSFDQKELKKIKYNSLLDSIYNVGIISGVQISHRNIEELISKDKFAGIISDSEGVIIGYSDTIEMIISEYQNKTLSINEGFLRNIHRTLLKYSQKDRTKLSQYKKINNYIKIQDLNDFISFASLETSSPFDTPNQVTIFFDFFNKYFRSEKFHNLVLLALLYAIFMNIYPFQNGNNRISYALIVSFMLAFGYDYIQYSSIEKIIVENKKDFYKELHNILFDLSKGRAKWNDWILCFLQIIRKHQIDLANKLGVKKDVFFEEKMPELSTSILNIIKKYNQVTVQELEKMTGANRNTIKLHLKKLVISNKLENHGKGRGSWYSQKNI